MTRNWIDELPTVEECDREIRRLTYWLETKRHTMGPREAVRIADRISSLRTKQLWARRFGKTDLW